MAVFSKHPASVPPAAPVRETTGHLMLRGWCVVVLIAAVAGPAVVDVFGAAGAGLLVVLSAVVSGVLWAVLRPPVQWRRMPWFVVAFAAWATLSLTWAASVQASAVTVALLLITTVQGVFIGAVLTWRELVRAVASAVKWVLALSIAFEVAVAVLVRGPILPGFVLPRGPLDPAAYWSGGHLFDGGRLQGIWGSASTLAVVCLVGIIVFAIRYTARAPRRSLLLVWIVVAGYLMYRAASPTAYLSLAAVIVVLITALLMRTAARPRTRTKYYVAYVLVASGGAAAVWFWREPIVAALGRPADGVWGDGGLQLGIIGAVLLGLVYLVFVWRAWFFAVDRPRWDLDAVRPYSPLTLLPTLIAAVLLVQGLVESAPLSTWGWMFLVMLGSKIKQAPLIGIGPAEQTLAIERGELVGRV